MDGGALGCFSIILDDCHFFETGIRIVYPSTNIFPCSVHARKLWATIVWYSFSGVFHEQQYCCSGNDSSSHCGSNTWGAQLSDISLSRKTIISSGSLIHLSTTLGDSGDPTLYGCGSARVGQFIAGSGNLLRNFRPPFCVVAAPILHGSYSNWPRVSSDDWWCFSNPSFHWCYSYAFRKF